MVQTSLVAWLSKPQSKPRGEISDSVELATDSRASNEHASRIVAAVTLDAAGQGRQSVEPDSNIARTTSRLPRNANIASITADTLPAFRRMTGLLLPVPYPDKFFKDIITDEVSANISLIALWNDLDPRLPPTKPRTVSGIRCRLINHPGPQSHGRTAEPSLYISTITTLAPFRGHGLASALLQRVTARAAREYGVTTVTAHMWEANGDAREWYSKHGFKEIHFEEKYYRRLNPAGAYLLEKVIGPRDLVDGEGR